MQQYFVMFCYIIALIKITLLTNLLTCNENGHIPLPPPPKEKTILILTLEGLKAQCTTHMHNVDGSTSAKNLCMI